MATDPVVSNASLPPEFCESYPQPLTGGCGVTPSAPTYHLNFDGVDDKITIPHAASISNLPLGDFTVEWAGTIARGLTGSVISKTNSSFEGWEVNVFGDFGLALWVTANNFAGYADAGFIVPASGIHHYEFVWSHLTASIKAFVDGVEVTYVNNEVVDYLSGTYDDDHLDNLGIGGHPSESGNNVPCSFSWLRISNTARHTSNFTPPSLTVCPSADANTVLRLAFDEGIGVTANDTSGNNNNGTISGAAWEVD